MIPVILGVLIALLINNWKESSENKRYLQRALDSMEKEVEESKTSVEEVLERHNIVIDSLVEHLENEDLSMREVFENAGGVQYPFIKNIALRFFVGGKVELIDYELISQMTDLEEAKRLLDNKFDKMMDFVYENMEKNDAQSKTLVLIHLSNVMDSESQLVELYANYLEALQ
jgi:uncharacterized protein YoxC